MKTRLFTLLLTIVTVCPSLSGMFQPLGSDYEALLHKAIEHVGNNKNSQAFTYLQWITIHDHNAFRKAGAYYGLGNISAQNKKYNMAEFYLRCAADQKENLLVRAQAQYDLGQIYLTQHKHRKAMCFFDKALQQHDDEKIKAIAGHALKRERELERATLLLLNLKQDKCKVSDDSKTVESTPKKRKSEDTQYE